MNGPAAKQRKARQEALRDFLSSQKHEEKVVDNIKKIEKLDVESESFSSELNKLKIANEQRLKLLNKYLPDIHHSTIDGDGDNGEIIIKTISYASDSPKRLDS